MPPQRTPLRSISSNSLPRTHLTPSTRGIIIGKKSEGAHAAQIARDLKLDVATVKYTIAKASLRNENCSIPHAPRRKSYTDTDERHLLRYVRLHPEDTYAQVIQACGLDCKTTTVKKILKRHGITNLRYRDFESKKHRNFTNSYIEVLDAQSAFSPNLNPIEHIWWARKKMVIEQYLELSKGAGKVEADLLAMEEALKNYWTKIPKETFDKLYQRLRSRDSRSKYFGNSPAIPGIKKDRRVDDDQAEAKFGLHPGSSATVRRNSKLYLGPDKHKRKLTP
ncbi:hypothetical protein G7Y89_g776 [Cudoniella acicularis]|uniref:Transposase n=1 Tax=Cudoniella acicularis TaxID=354080 RepID=A0A8H4RXJ3_9HELO|nr:hypothetical protein G7Y89_g776 [Cudoniella acicularis]